VGMILTQGSCLTVFLIDIYGIWMMFGRITHFVVVPGDVLEDTVLYRTYSIWSSNNKSHFLPAGGNW
jgi:hypothetical protein